MLESLGLSGVACALYERLLAEYAIPLAPGHCLDTGAVDELLARGLAVRMPEDYAGNAHVEEPRLVAVPPDDAVSRLLIEEEHRITEERERLLRVRRDFPLVRSMFETARSGAEDADLVQLLVGRNEVGAAYKTVVRSAIHELSLLDTAHFDAAPDPAQVTPVAAEEVLAGRLSYRTIYDHSIYTEYPEYMHYMLERSRTDGEVQRIVPRLPIKMLLADETLALVSLTRSGMDGAMLVRSKRLLSLLRNLFEMLWAQATPLLGEADSAPARHAYGQIPALLGAGLGDDAIARQLGVGLRTLRRRIAEMNEELDAHSRFQAGVLAERRGFVRIDGS